VGGGPRFCATFSFAHNCEEEPFAPLRLPRGRQIMVCFHFSFSFAKASHSLILKETCESFFFPPLNANLLTSRRWGRNSALVGRTKTPKPILYSG